MFSVRLNLTFLSILLTFVCPTWAQSQFQSTPKSCLNLIQVHEPQKVWQQTASSKKMARVFSDYFQRKITLEEQRALEEALRADDGPVAYSWIQSTASFSKQERHLVFQEMPALRSLSQRWLREEYYLNYHFRNFKDPSKVWHDSSLKPLENQLGQFIQDKVRFHIEHLELGLFNRFRLLSPIEIREIYAGTAVRKKIEEDNAVFVDKFLASNSIETPFQWSDFSKQEYERVIFVIQNLGKTSMRNFPKEFGHVDHQASSKIFSLRLNPEINIEKNKVSANKNTNIRALMGVDENGIVHVLKVYQKLSFLDPEGFKSIEQDYYQEALQSAQRLGLKLVDPTP